MNWLINLFKKFANWVKGLFSKEDPKLSSGGDAEYIASYRVK